MLWELGMDCLPLRFGARTRTLGGGSGGDLGFDDHAHRGLARLGGDISHTRSLFGDGLLGGSFGDRACCHRLVRGRFVDDARHLCELLRDSSTHLAFGPFDGDSGEAACRA